MGLTQVSTDGVKNDAITKTKIPANQIETSELASSAVTNVKIAAGNVDNTAIGNNQVSLNKLVQGTSSNDGKFLRANNGADPSFETVSIPAGTTITNNADNRLITGSGTANTLEGEAGLTFGSAVLSVTGNVVPEANNTRDLGTTSLRWANVYTNDLNLSNEGSSNSIDGTWGSYTIQEGAKDLFLINKRNNKKYKFNLTEVS